MKRRTFLAYGLVAGLSAARGYAELSFVNAVQNPSQPNAFSPLKKKLMAGQSATLLIVSDSTGYLVASGTRKFIRWLAAQYPAHRVTERLWAEWTAKGATGPKLYGDPMVIAEGTTPATLTVLNAALPGACAQAMIDGSRWAPMLDPLHDQPPDLILWNHGHNHQANIPLNNFAYGRGTIYAPLGRMGMEFPKAPQAAILQNPWRDNDGYERVRDWWLAAAEALPALNLVDGYAPFIEQNKQPTFYMDNVHPSERGYELICQQLVAAWSASAPQADWPGTDWARLPAEPLVGNGDLADWTAATPTNWQTVKNGSVRKDREHTFGKAQYSLALTGSTQNDGVQVKLSKDALARTRGKPISVAILCYIPRAAEQDLQVKFTTSSSDQVTGSIEFARDNWKWIVLAGCRVPPEATYAVVGLYRSFAKPPNDVPFYIQKLVIVAGDQPQGGM